MGAGDLSSTWVVAAATSVVALLASACSTPTDHQPPEGRDPLTWPYPADSIWNHPRGDSARLVPFPVSSAAGTVTIEEDLLVVDPDAPLRDVHLTTAEWDRGVTRCGEATDQVLVDDLPIPEGWVTDPGYTGDTPNHAAAVVLPDLTLAELQPLHVCPDGDVVAGHAPQAWQGSSLVTGGTADEVGSGSHGGSGMTAFGGTVRLGEWVPGGQIRHAVKLTIDARQLSPTDQGYRWPAHHADAYYARRYDGSVPAARMGALLTLSPSFDLASLRSEAARILAQAVQLFGAYVVDDRGYDAVGVAVEWGPQGRVRDEFEQRWGFPLAGRLGEGNDDQNDFTEDLARVWASLQVVDDNGPDSIGGAGDPLTAFAPPFSGKTLAAAGVS